MSSSNKNLDTAPEDSRSFVYIMFYWLGIGTLLPWNFFISVSEYWKYKYRTIEEPTGEELEISGNSTSLNDMQMNWGPHLSMASMVPNVTFLLLNAAFGHRWPTQPRLLVSLVMVILLFIFTDVMVKLDTDSWQQMFYYVTLGSVVLININAAIFQGGLLGLAGKFPPRYMGGVFSGQALGGIFASVTNLVFLAFGATVVNAAFFDFLIAVLFLGTALVGYIMMTRNHFFQHFAGEGGDKTDAMPVPEDKALVTDEKDVKIQLPVKVNPLRIFGKIWVYAVSVFLTFAVTLSVFPAVTLLIVSTGEPGSAWASTYFIPVACFLLFNVGDYLGRVLAEKIRWPKPGKVGMWITFVVTVLRISFIPLFLICNAAPNDRNVTSVVFESDVAYIIIMLLFSLTNGYFGSICMMCAPQITDPEEAQTAASIMVALLGLGLGVGSALSNFTVKLI